MCACAFAIFIVT